MKTSRFRSWLLLALFFVINIISINAQQGTWIEKANFGGGKRENAVGFSIGDKGYIGTGHYNSLKKDFWEYDPTTNSWTQKADFGGTARQYAVGFSIENKGYIGLGDDGNLRKDFWEYNPTTNSWAQKTDFGGTARNTPIGFSIGDRGYIGTGYDGSLKKDFWEYDPTTNSWIQKADFGGTARVGAVGFAIGTKGYVGTGNDGQLKNDFWEYDPSINSWIQKNNFAGKERSDAVAYSINSKGYIGTGYSNTNDFWEYDSNSDSWLQKQNLSGSSSAVGFSIGTNGYIGTGTSGSVWQSEKFFEFNPCSKPVIVQQTLYNQNRCMGENVTFTVSVIKDGLLSYQWKKDGNTINGATSDTLTIDSVIASDEGSYSCYISYDCGSSISSNASYLVVNKNVPISVNISATPSGAICSDANVTFTATTSSGNTAPSYRWLINGKDPLFSAWSYSSVFQTKYLSNGDSVTCEVTSNPECPSPYIAMSNVIKMTVDTNTVIVNITKNPNGLVCKGSIVSFNASTVNGGTNPTYQWKVNGLNVGTNNPEFNSSTLSNGDSVICELTSNAFCVSNNIASSNPQVATIHSFPIAHKSYVEISKCSNCSVELDALEGATYFWSPAEGLSATNIKNPMANPIITTTYVVQITDSNGCTCTDTTKVVVKPSFSIEAINDTTIQKGQSLQLGIKPILYNVKISFYLENTFYQKHFLIKNSITGKTVFGISVNENIYFDWNGGNFESIEKMESGDYYIDDLRAWEYSVIPSVGTFLNNKNFSVGGKDYTYSWQPEIYLDNASIANPESTPLTDTQYIVTVNTNQGCVAKDTLNVKVINSTGLNIQKATNDYVIYPNPITESFQINGIDEVVTIRIIDVSGRIMLSKQLVGNEQIFVSSLPKGLYIVKIYTNKGGIERKLVKK